jgi:hypothetical protein
MPHLIWCKFVLIFLQDLIHFTLIYFWQWQWICILFLVNVATCLIRTNRTRGYTDLNPVIKCLFAKTVCRNRTELIGSLSLFLCKESMQETNVNACFKCRD